MVKNIKINKEITEKVKKVKDEEDLLDSGETDEQEILELEYMDYLLQDLEKYHYPHELKPHETVYSSVSGFLQERFYEYEESRPHLPGGLSNAGACALSQILDEIDPQERERTGAFAPGTALHEFMQEKVLPVGSDFEYNGKHYQILGHEQLVFLMYQDNNGNKKIWRKSPIDTLVWDVDEEKFEIWDWKSTRMDLKYMKTNKTRYLVQGALYSYLFAKQLQLPYYPIVRFIYVNKAEWDEFKDISFSDNIEKIAEAAIRKLELVRLGKRNFGFVIQNLLKFADGLQIWSDTKKQYRQECKYCVHQDYCLKLLRGKGYNLTLDDLLYKKDIEMTGVQIKLNKKRMKEPLF